MIFKIATSAAALAGLPDWNGRIVIDANNPIGRCHCSSRSISKGRVSSDVFAELVLGARAVKALSQCLIIVDEMAESFNKQGSVGIVGMLRIDREE